MAKHETVEGPKLGQPDGTRDGGFADRLLASGKCPIAALMRLGRSAEAEGNLSLAKTAYSAVLPYIHAKPKSVESDIDAVAELVRRTLEAKRKARQEHREIKPKSHFELMRMYQEREP
jgi:hypothetical protein